MGVGARIQAAWRGLSGKASNPEQIWREMNYRPSRTGMSVTIDSAMAVSAVLGCVRVLAEGCAQVPFKVMRETSPGQKSEARDLALYEVLAQRPNEWQDAFQFRETMVTHLALTGNFFAFKNFSLMRGGVFELIPFLPQDVTVKKSAENSYVYTVRGKGGGQQEFPQEAIWHVRGLSWDGMLGLDPLKLAREAVGLSMAAEASQGSLHKDGVRVSGVYSVEGTLAPEQYQQLHDWIKKTALGGVNDGGVMVLDRAAKFQPTTMTGVDAQHLETRRFQIEDICRFYRVMPIMIGHADKTATYASAEQMFLAHVVHTLMPWYKRIEAAADVQLLTPEQRAAGYFTKFNANALMRGASQQRAAFYGAGIKDGWMTRNEARDAEDMNRLEGLDEPLSPLNMGPGAGDSPGDPAQPTEKPNADA